MKLSRLQWIALGALGFILVAGALVFLLREPIQDKVNGIRAERLFEKAETAFMEERWEQAARQAQAAYYLDSDNRDIQLLIARSTLKQRMRTTVEWWYQVLEEPDLPVEELRELTGGLLAGGDLENGLVFLNRLTELAPDDPATKRLMLQSLELQKRYSSALDFAGEMARAGDDSWDVHQFYMAFEEQLNPGEGEEKVLEHLKALIEGGTELALPAARDLVLRLGAPAEDRLAAAAYLNEHAADQLDELFAQSVRAREGLASEEAVKEIVLELLEDPDAFTMQTLLNWANFMNATTWLLDTVSFTSYVESGASEELYFSLLYRTGAYAELLDLVEDVLSQEDSAASSMIHYYRAVALRNLGEEIRAQDALNVAVRVADPADSGTLEANLIRDQEWALLIGFYDTLRANEPDNSTLDLKLLAAYYYLGKQEGMKPVLEDLKMESFIIDNPPQASFLLYLKLVVEGYSPELHQQIEGLQARFPQISDFVPVLALSYLLQGEERVARDFVDEIPELGLSTARYLRVCTILIGRPEDGLLMPGEKEFMLPRELYLLSRYASGSSR